MKKIALGIVLGIISSCFSFVVGYSYGWSNIGGYYPPFTSYIGYNPTREELGRYLDEAQEYIESCDRDIELIIQERNEAVDSANSAIERYQFSH